MHFTIIGAGAIGGTVGAHPVRGGHEGLFVDRDRARGDVMNTAGLTIEGRETFTARVRGLEEVFRSCLLPATQATSNIWGFLWGKLGYGAMLFATALVDASIADVLAHAPSRPMLANLAAEVVRVAQAEGVRCEGFDGYEPAA